MSEEQSTTTFTPSERIAQISEIDSQIAFLLQSAGQALQSLTNPSSTSDVESSRTTFRSNVRDYFSTLSAIDVGLRRQIYALQEAGLIQEGTAKDARDALARSDTRSVGESGGLDASWLNSRAKDKVGKGMEAELWERAGQLVDKLNGTGGAHAQKQDIGDDMDVEKEDGSDTQSGG